MTRRATCLACLLLAVATAAAVPAASGKVRQAAGPGKARTESPRKGAKMSASQIVERIRMKDWRIVQEPGSIGPDAVPAILPLLGEQDPEVRELALACLDDAGGEAAARAIVGALRDPEESVRAQAARSLPRHATAAHLSDLMKDVAASGDENVREHAALALGRIGNASTVNALHRRLGVEKDEDARHAMSLAMARLGDKAASKRFAERFRSREPKALAAALKDYAYVADPRFLPDVLPLLDDARDALNMAPSNAVFFVRVCDLAVVALDAALAHPFSFEVSQVKRYPPEELNQAREVVRKRAAGVKP